MCDTRPALQINIVSIARCLQRPPDSTHNTITNGLSILFGTIAQKPHNGERGPANVTTKPIPTLKKKKRRHIDNICVTIRRCHFNNLRCNQWKFRQNGISVSYWQVSMQSVTKISITWYFRFDLTTHSATSGENFVSMTTYLFQWIRFPRTKWRPHHTQ